MKLILNRLAILAAFNLGVLAQPVVITPPANSNPNNRYTIVEPPEKVENAAAVVLDVQGDCQVSNDGTNFRILKKSAELGDNVTIRTGAQGSADVFLKRMGTTVRLKPNTEISLNRVSKKKDERHELATTVDVRKGKMLAVVHSNVAGSSLEIKNAVGKKLTDTTAGSRYMVSADTIENTKSGANFDSKISATIKDQIDIDDLRATTETINTSGNPGLEK
jgi:hypothetical protein